MWVSYAGDVTNRIDQWMYGRYVEGVIAPILLIGALSAASRKKLIGTLAIAVFSASVLALSTVLDSYEGYARFNISAFWQAILLLEWGIWVWLATGCALIIFAASLPRKAAMIFIALLFLFSSFLQIQWHTWASRAVSNRWHSALSVRDQFAPGTCVGFDHQTIIDHNQHAFWFDFGLILFDYKLQKLPLETWLTTCDGPLFTFDENLDERNANVYPITSIKNEGPVAWMKGRPPIDLYPITVSNTEPSSTLINALSSGWSNLEKGYVWSGADALLKIPVPEECNSGACSVILILSVHGASQQRPTEVIFKAGTGNAPFKPTFIARSPFRHIITLPLDGSRAISNLHIEIPNATSPSELHGTHDNRILGVALYSIELETP